MQKTLSTSPLPRLVTSKEVPLGISKSQTQVAEPEYATTICMHNQDTLWIRCPICAAKTRTKVYPHTVLVNFPLYCPKCKKEIMINVVQLRMTVSTTKSL